MKILICSDIHGSKRACLYIKKLMEENNFDYLFLLGDNLYNGPRNYVEEDYDPKFCFETLNLFSDKIVACKGNCESDVDLMVLQFKLPKFNAIKLSDKTFYLIHGDDDTYDIKELKKNEILLKGHTHIPLMQKLGKGIYLNPGSMTFPKGSLDKSYMIFTDDDIKLIEFEYDNNDNPCIKSEKYYSKEQKIYNKLG